VSHSDVPAIGIAQMLIDLLNRPPRQNRSMIAPSNLIADLAKADTVAIQIHRTYLDRDAFGGGRNSRGVPGAPEQTTRCNMDSGIQKPDHSPSDDQRRVARCNISILGKA
jgi:hypothetical protein